MNGFKLGSLVSMLTALLTGICMAFEIFGHQTNYDVVTIEAAIIGVCFVVNLVCAVARLIQETHKK